MSAGFNEVLTWGFKSKNITGLKIQQDMIPGYHCKNPWLVEMILNLWLIGKSKYKCVVLNRIPNQRNEWGALC